MPELPEVETVRRTLAPRLLGQTVKQARVIRRDVITGRAASADLLVGGKVVDILRHGKQLAIVAQSNGVSVVRRSSERKSSHGPRVICVHLGMTGSLRYVAARAALAALGPHQHVRWRLSDDGWLVLRDPRRFGRLRTFGDPESLWRENWSKLGPDALTIEPRQLHARLTKTSRSLKAALLDQQIIAGLGNIYVDELLFAAGLHPLTCANNLSLTQTQGLVRRMRRILKRSIAHGGTTLRDYVNGAGDPGWFKQSLHVYGRSDQPCRQCHRVLEKMIVASRSTVFCPRCQGGKSRVSRTDVQCRTS